MILTISIGNSNITIGGYEGERVFTAEIKSEPGRTSDQYAAEIKSVMELYGVGTSAVEGAIIGSVVPKLTSVLAEGLEKIFKIKPVMLGPGIKSGLNIRIENPAQLGADIVAAAVAAMNLKKKMPCIVCNLGTATVMGVIDSEEIFRGVVIAAGVDTTLEGFTKKTALLAEVDLEAPKNVIGKNSAQSVQSGLIFGTAAMIDGLISRIERELGEKARVVATGRMCRHIIPYCEREIEICEHLTSDGLYLIYEKNLQSKQKKSGKEEKRI